MLTRTKHGTRASALTNVLARRPARGVDGVQLASPRVGVAKAALLLVVLALCSCDSEPLQRQVDRERAAIDACKQEALTGGADASTPDRPWRITSSRSGEAVVVNIWTHTPRSAPRPSGEPDHVCRR